MYKKYISKLLVFLSILGLSLTLLGLETTYAQVPNPQQEEADANSASCSVINIKSGQLALRFSPGGKSRAGLDNGNTVTWLHYVTLRGVSWAYVLVTNGPNDNVTGLKGWVNSAYLDCDTK